MQLESNQEENISGQLLHSWTGTDTGRKKEQVCVGSGNCVDFDCEGAPSVKKKTKSTDQVIMRTRKTLGS